VARDVRVAILGDSRDFSRAVRSAQGDAGRLNDSFHRVNDGVGRMARGAALGIAGVAVAGGALAIGFLRAAEESEQVARQTDAVLRSMDALAWTSADAVAAQATNLSNMSGIDDELIQMGQNRLLTFGNIQDNFERTTAAMVDIAAARGEDMTSVAEAIGKALNDPASGLQRLTRMGIQFTDQQEDQVRAMVEAGDVAGAQAVMLEELERQYGGSAAAQATASQRLSTIWGNLQEQLGGYLLPYAEKFATWMGENLPGALERAKDFIGDVVEKGKELSGWIVEEFGPAFETGKDVVGKIVEKGQEFTDWLGDNQPIVEAALGGIAVGFTVWALAASAAAIATALANAPLIIIIAAIALVAAGLIWAYQNCDWFREAVDKVAKFLTETAWPAFQDGVGFMKDLVTNGFDVVETAFNAIKTTAETVWPAIVAAFNAAKGPIMFVLNPILDAFRLAIDLWGQLQRAIGQAGDNKQIVAVPSSGGRVSGRAGGGNKTFHNGGTFRAPSGSGEGLVTLRHGEQVLTPGQAAGRGSSDGQPIQVQVILDGNVVADSLARYTNRGGVLQVRVA
jgi:hypothetical protein